MGGELTPQNNIGALVVTARIMPRCPRHHPVVDNSSRIHEKKRGDKKLLIKRHEWNRRRAAIEEVACFKGKVHIQEK